MFDDENVALAGLATMAPGPRLAVVLASIDRDRLEGFEQVVVMQAWARLVAYGEAELRASITQVASTVGEVWGTPGGQVDEFAADEVAPALTWTRQAATWEVGFSWHLVMRFPQVQEALRAGRIDLRKARVIVEGLCHLDHDLAGEVAASLLEKAPGWTSGKLGSELKKRVIEADPDGATQRYERAVKRRQVVAEPDTVAGTASIYATDLPVDRVAAAMENVNALARSAKSEQDGRSMDQVRADVFLDLLEGRGAVGTYRRGVVDIRVDLATLAGLSETPGELLGMGPVIADIARQVAATRIDAQWRVAATDPDTGAVVWDGITRRRPTAAQRRHIAARIATCVFPGCRRPAINCDIDHRRPWARGGPTAIENLAPLCRHHHRSKDEAKWRLERLDISTYRWTSPLGHKYVVQPGAP